MDTMVLQPPKMGLIDDSNRDVNFSSSMKFSGKKDQFIANERNKQAMSSKN